MPQIHRTLDTETLELQGTRKYADTTWQQVWHPTLNQGLQLSQLPAHSMQKVYLVKICGKHIAYQSMKSATSNKHKPWFNCKICGMWYNKRHVPIATRPERTVLNILDARYAPDDFFLDCRIVLDNTKVGSIDVWMPKDNLAIMIDGSSHFVHKYDTDKSTQRRIDDRFCVCALKQCHVLRVHYSDVSHIVELIRLVKVAASRTTGHVLHYSNAFHKHKFVDEQHIADILAKSAAEPDTVDTTAAL